MASSSDNSVHLYNGMKSTPTQEKTLHNKDLGHNIVRFTHHKDTILTNSKAKGGNDQPGMLQMWCLHDNQRVRERGGSVVAEVVWSCCLPCLPCRA